MAFLNSNFLAQGIVDSFNQTAVAPAAEVFPDNAVRREIVGQKPPSAAGAGLVEDGVPDFTQGVLTWASGPSLFGCGENSLNALPLWVSQVTWVR